MKSKRSFRINFFCLQAFALLALFAATASQLYAQGMSDSQVMNFVARETKAGTSQAQIVTKLIQRGVKIDQIRRIRNQYDSQLTSKGLDRAADGAINAATDRMRQNNDDTSSQELNTAKEGTSGEIYTNATEEVAEVEHDVQATSSTNDATGKKVFGRDIFNKRRLSFEPNMNMPTPQNYVLGPGDVLIVDIYGASQKTLSLKVSPEGTVTVPGYGPIAVNGLTVAQANGKIRSTVGSRYSSSDIRVTVGQTRTIMVNIMGEVRTPGTYHLSAFSSVFHALYMAGGITSLGTLRNIKVFRGGRLVTVVDVYEYILNGRLAGDIRLQDNDVIQVGPYDCIVGITGSVKRSMFYEMRKNESVATLVKFAGGFTGDAYTKSVRLVRQTGERYSVHNISEFDLSSFQLADGDAITVDGMINRYENMVEIKGAVFRPGQFRLGEQVSSVRSLIEAAEGLTEDAMTMRGVIHRLKADRSLEVLSVDLGGILNGTVADVPLQNEDVLFVPTEADLRKERTYTIHGEVLSPGTYEFADNTTIEDIIIMAGGLTDAASTAKVDVTRRILNPKATTTSSVIAKTYTFSLKDNFVIDGQPGFILEPYDEIYVRRSPGFERQRNIRVDGEVLFGGTQALYKKNQRLSDAIKAAGGVTPDAYVRGARLERVMNVDEAARRSFLIKQLRAQVNERDTIDLAKLELGNTYMVGINLDKALENPGSDWDIILREGDRIVVPELNNTVKVSGDVMFPNTVNYIAGKNYKYYVKQAGGFGSKAKKAKTWIIYQNGTMGLVNKGAKIEPGCEIIVPTKPHKNNLNFAQWLSVGTTLTSLAAMVATIVNVTK